MTKAVSLRDQTTEFLLYTAPNGAIKVGGAAQQRNHLADAKAHG